MYNLDAIAKGGVCQFGIERGDSYLLTSGEQLLHYFRADIARRTGDENGMSYDRAIASNLSKQVK